MAKYFFRCFETAKGEIYMQITNNQYNYTNPSFGKFDFSSQAKFILKDVLKNKDPEYVSKCLKVISSQEPNPVQIDMYSHHNYWEDHLTDKLRAEINGEPFMSKRRDDVLNFLEKLAKEADKRFGIKLYDGNIDPQEAVGDMINKIDRLI